MLGQLVLSFFPYNLCASLSPCGFSSRVAGLPRWQLRTPRREYFKKEEEEIASPLKGHIQNLCHVYPVHFMC